MLLLLAGKRRRWQKVNGAHDIADDVDDIHKRSRNELQPCSSDHTRLLDPQDDVPPALTPPHCEIRLPCPIPYDPFPLQSTEHSRLVHAQRPPNHNTSSNSPAFPLAKFPSDWETDMISFIAASRLCREEAVACSLLSDGIPDDLPFPPSLTTQDSLVQMAKQKKKKVKTKSSSVACDSSSKALHVSQCNSWRIMKKLLSKQFMPFSTNKGNSKTSTRILQSRNNVLDVQSECRSVVMDHKNSKKLKGKQSQMKYGDENRSVAI